MEKVWGGSLLTPNGTFCHLQLCLHNSGFTPPCSHALLRWFSPFLRIPHFCWRSVCCDAGGFLLCSLPCSVPSIPTCIGETVAVPACRWLRNWSMTGVMCMHVISALPELKSQRQENCQEWKRLAWATVTIHLQKPKLEEKTKQDIQTNKQNPLFANHRAGWVPVHLSAADLGCGFLFASPCVVECLRCVSR